MNILPILLFGLLLKGESFSSIKDLLLKIDFASFSPVLQLLGVDKKTIDFLSSEEFEQNLSNGDFKSLIPLVSSLFSKPQAKVVEDDDEQSAHCDYVSPIKNVAPTDIGATIENYFNWLPYISYKHRVLNKPLIALD